MLNSVISYEIRYQHNHVDTYIHIHYDTNIDLTQVVDIFAAKQPRRLEFRTLLKD